MRAKLELGYQGTTPLNRGRWTNFLPAPDRRTPLSAYSVGWTWYLRHRSRARLPPGQAAFQGLGDGGVVPAAQGIGLGRGQGQRQCPGGMGCAGARHAVQARREDIGAVVGAAGGGHEHR